MFRRLSPYVVVVLLAVAAAPAGGCHGSSQTAAVLDPTQPHYGYTDSQWGAFWWQWLYQLPETNINDCIIPLTDPTGASCGYDQSGDVFYLVGTTGGTIVRNQCVVPLGKAIFFPIVNFSADNGGVPVGMQETDAELMEDVQTDLASVPVSSLSAEFDGVTITNLAAYETQITQYSYTLPPEPNVYTCEGEPGVTGLVSPSYAAGYYVMLAPPAAGAHTLHFSAEIDSQQQGMPPTTQDVTYNFVVANVDAGSESVPPAEGGEMESEASEGGSDAGASDANQGDAGPDGSAADASQGDAGPDGSAADANEEDDGATTD